MTLFFSGLWYSLEEGGLTVQVKGLVCVRVGMGTRMGANKGSGRNPKVLTTQKQYFCQRAVLSFMLIIADLKSYSWG